MLLLCQYSETLSRREGLDLFLQGKTIPEFPEIFSGIELVSIIYVRYCRLVIEILNNLVVSLPFGKYKLLKANLKKKILDLYSFR